MRLDIISKLNTHTMFSKCCLKNFFIFSLFLLVCLPFYATEPLIPKSLKHLLTSKHLGYRILTFSDFNPETREIFKDTLPPENPGCITADFDGNGKPDYVILLINEKLKDIQLVVFFSQSNGKWHQEILGNKSYKDWGFKPNDRVFFEFYLKLLPPGKYESILPDTWLTPELEKQGYRATFEAKSPGVYFGKLETEGNAYFWFDGKLIRMEF